MKFFKTTSPKTKTALVFDVAADEQESIRSWVSKGGLSWCDNCTVPITRHNRCDVCGKETRPIDTNLRGETRPIFPGERSTQGIDGVVPEDAWLAVTDNTDLAYNVIIDGMIVGDLVFDDGWKVKLSTRTLHAGLYFSPKIEINVLALGQVLNFHTISEMWISSIAPVKESECIVYSCGDRIGLARALTSISPGAIAGTKPALQILSVFKKEASGVQKKPLRFQPDSDVMRSNWRFSTLPAPFKKRLQKVIDANLSTIKSMEKRALDRIDEAIKANPGKPIGISFSGGKDSALLTEILRQYHNQRNSSARIHALFADTSIEFPETYKYVEEFFTEPRYLDIFELRWKKPAREFFDLWNEYGPPSRYARWCCGTQKLGSINAILQEFGSQALICNGVRAAESVARSRRTIVDTNPYIQNQVVIQPILDWGLLDVWLYIFWRDVLMSPLYLMGFNRTGCYPCPYSSNSILATLEQTHPKLMMKLQGKLKEFHVNEDFRFRIPPDIDQSLKPLENSQANSTEDLQIQNLCAGEYFVFRRAPLVLDLNKAAQKLVEGFKVTQVTQYLLLAEDSRSRKFRLSRTGRMVISGALNQKEAKGLYGSVMGLLTGSNGQVQCVGCEMGTVQLDLKIGDRNVSA